MEREYSVLGVSGIEDCLQEEVAETIQVRFIGGLRASSSARADSAVAGDGGPGDDGGERVSRVRAAGRGRLAAEGGGEVSEGCEGEE